MDSAGWNTIPNFQISYFQLISNKTTSENVVEKADQDESGWVSKDVFALFRNELHFSESVVKFLLADVQIAVQAS